jgi:hypothetical protein
LRFALDLTSPNQNRPALPGGFIWISFYSPLPKRRDHQPARRGAPGVSSVASGTGSGAGGATGSGVDATGAASSGGPLDRKLTFSRTVERRRAALSSDAASSSATAAEGAGCTGVSTGAWN